MQPIRTTLDAMILNRDEAAERIVELTKEIEQRKKALAIMDREIEVELRREGVKVKWTDACMNPGLGYAMRCAECKFKRECRSSKKKA